MKSLVKQIFPFDEEMAGISSHALPSYVPNRYKANGGVEYGDEEWSNGSGLEMYETFYRSYNAQIGRFMQGDPMMEATVSMSGYVFSGNNPVMFTDPFGDLTQAAWDDVLSRLGNGSNLDGFGQYGGYYNEGGGGGGGGGGFTPFSSDAEAFGWGASEMDANNWWGTQSGWAGSFNEAYQNFSAGSLTEGEKGYNYINAKFSGAYSNSRYTKDVEYNRDAGEKFYFAGYGNIFDFNAIISGYQVQQGASWYEWDGPVFRAITPDFVSVGVGFNGIVGIGAGTSIEFNWVLHGPEASWKPVLTATQSIGGGYSVDATFNIGTVRYSGNPKLINRKMLETNTVQNGDYPAIWGSAGVTAGGKIGITRSETNLTTGGVLSGFQINIGAGLPLGPVPVNASIGVSNTWVLYDWYFK